MAKSFSNDEYIYIYIYMSVDDYRDRTKQICLWMTIEIIATGRYCLATLMSSDRTKQICQWMTIYIYIYIYIYAEGVT